MSFDFSCRPVAKQRLAIEKLTRAPEAECLLVLRDEARLLPDEQAKVTAYALQLVSTVRARRTRSSGVDALMREFSLSSDEGVALMCLAEALLRIPDSTTRDALIRDKIGGGDWQAHLGRSPSLFVNAASWGLVLTGKLVSTHSQDSLGSALARLVGKGGEPVIRRAVDLAMRMLGRQFVTGETIEDAIENGAPNRARGYRYSYDMLGEAALTKSDALRYLEAYQHAIDVIGRESKSGPSGVRQGPGISIKLSALHPRYQRAQRERVMAELLPVLKELARRAASFDIGLNIDAEESERLDLSLDLLEALAQDQSTAGWQGLGFVIQAYSKRAPAVIDFVAELARSSSRRLMVRLVKGAYWDSEIKRAQIEGQSDYPVYTRKAHTDVAYQACARRLLRASDAIYPQFATHNAYSLAWVREAARSLGVKEDQYEFQCLHGMGETLYDQVIDGSSALCCRIYAPVGSHETLLAYLVRRLLENGANSSFVNRIVDENVPVLALAEDPVLSLQRDGGAPHPRIVLPELLYTSARRNSRGFDTASDTQLGAMQDALGKFDSSNWLAAPSGAASDPASIAECRNPADRRDLVGHVVNTGSAQVEAAIKVATSASRSWSRLSSTLRAELLDHAAVKLEDNRAELIALLMREAGKSLSNALGEVREAVDFCRYYAWGIRHSDAPIPEGAPLVCISPWNFPLAIFCGQVVAALAAGRCVLAKPAEQTPLVAARAVALLHAAGVPREVLQLLPGDGPNVGAALVADARIGGVLFTGSTEVARGIARTLATRLDDPVLIAETGGVNAMLVDSSALTEQVVQDALQSAFDSAGQRCSALRLLCVQEDAAKSTLAMLYGAFEELSVGVPMRLANDIGPVIDEESRERLEAYIKAMQKRGFPVRRLALGAEAEHGSFVAPTIIEIQRLSDLPGEVFGPVLHVMRYRASEFDALIESINAMGFGLTMGIHSRIDEHIGRAAERARIGNLYVNRNMIGAVVGVQPFGGEGMSGTGPKAGGPLYLPRLGVPLTAPGRNGARDASIDGFLRRAAQGAFSAAEKSALEALAARLKSINFSELSVALSGPTGESNTLTFVARDVVGCIAPSAAGTAMLALMVLALGGRPLAPQNNIDPALQSSIGVLPQDMPVDALLIDADDTERLAWQQRIAARSGALVPIIPLNTAAMTVTPSLLARLLHERSVSTNTAAAGGNAALMMLGDD
jgi:RHH-type proline utilization regulon transcriptional repressor/proline dehydrogenase/delta 1-pyrroline-5-carboxylate dehydrogenase